MYALAIILVWLSVHSSVTFVIFVKTLDVSSNLFHHLVVHHFNESLTDILTPVSDIPSR